MGPPGPSSLHAGNARWSCWRGSTRSEGALNYQEVKLGPGASKQVSGQFPPHYWLLAIHLQIRLPHVRADEADLGDDFLAHGGEESLEGFSGSFSAYPQQAGDADVDLVDQGQVLVAFSVLDFIDANGVDLTERAVLQSPGDDMFDRIEYLVPGSAKALCGFFPRKPARPTS